MIDPLTQSQKIEEKTKQIAEEFFKTAKMFGDGVHEIENEQKEITDVIHAAVASGYLLALQTMHEASQIPMQTAPEIHDELSTRENIRGM